MIIITQFDWLTDRGSQMHRVKIVLHRLKYMRFLGLRLRISSECVCHLGYKESFCDFYTVATKP